MKSIILRVIFGWILLIVEEASYAFLIPHGPHFAPEIGPFGSFLFFATFLTFGYVASFAVLASYIARSRSWQKVLGGTIKQALVFSALASVFTAALLAGIKDLWAYLLVFLLPGAVCVSGIAQSGFAPNHSLQGRRP